MATTIEQALSALSDKTRRFLDGARGEIGEAGPGQLSHRPRVTEFEAKGNVVKVSDVMAAAQLLAARWALQEYPAKLRAQIELLLVKGGSRVLAKVGAISAGKAIPGVGTLAGLLGDAAATVEETGVFLALEDLVRSLGAAARRDLQSRCLFPTHKRARKVRDVHTRHETPKKKRMNKWKSR